MTAIRLRGPADVLAALPYQLGYHPEDSVVVLALSDGVVGLVERLDLPPPSAAVEAASSLVLPVLRSGSDAVVVLGYEKVEGRARPILDALATHFGREGVTIVHRLLVREGLWFGLDCLTECCPAEGQPLPDAASTPAVASFVRLGVAPRARRADLAAAVAADPGLSAAVAAELSKRAPAHPGSAFFRAAAPGADLRMTARRLALLSVWRDVLAVGTECTDDPADLPTGSRPTPTSARAATPAEVAELVRSLGDLQLRDGLLAWLCPGFLEPSDLDEDLVDALLSTLGPFPVARPDPWPDPWPETRSATSSATARRAGELLSGKPLLQRLEELVRAVPSGEAAPLATVFAYVAWYYGDGTLARVALDRAFAEVPDYRLAALVDQLLDVGLRPSALGLAPPRDEQVRGVQFPDVSR